MKYTKYLAILAAAFMMGSCSDDFLDKEPSENASEDQIKDLLDKDPTAIQAYITGYYKNMFSPEAQQSHDDFGLKAFELATDLMGDDMAYMTSHFFVYDYLLDNRASSYRRTTTYWQELYAVISGANEVISGLKEQADSGDESVEKMLGQSYTIRAYCYFWLINMYQQPYEWNKDKLGIPIYTESETKLNRVPVSEVYEQILSDIDKGYNYLKGKGIAKKDELNEYAAAAIYANILSFVNDYPDQWNEVAKYAKLAIEGGSLMSEKELLSGFNDLSLSEVLWGADINGETNTFYASFMSQVDPYGPGYGGNLGNYKMISSDLYEKISDDDIRKKWFGVDLNLERKKIDPIWYAFEPTVLYNKMLAPMLPLTVKGVIWYQGESNVERPEQYRMLFPELVRTWRRYFADDNLPFYYVQIAPYNHQKVNSAIFREVQLDCMRIIPNVGMVVTLDVGEADIIHPARKEVVGERLAYLPDF